MAIRTLITLLLVLTGSLATAQQVYFRAYGTLAAPTASDILEVSQFTDSSGALTQRNVTTTLGGGFMFGGEIGYQFNEYFGAEIGFQYLASNKIVARETQSATVDILAETYTRMGRANLGVTLNSGGQGLRARMRMGVLAPVFGGTFVEADFTLKPPLPESRIFTKTVNRGRPALGWYGGVGAEYPIGDRIRLSAEVAVTYLRIKSRTQSILEQYDANTGDDLLPSLTTSEREIIYRDEITSSSNNRNLNSANFDTDQAEELLAFTSNYSNLGLRLGIAFVLFGE